MEGGGRARDAVSETPGLLKVCAKSLATSGAAIEAVLTVDIGAGAVALTLV